MGFWKIYSLDIPFSRTFLNLDMKIFPCLWIFYLLNVPTGRRGYLGSLQTGQFQNKRNRYGNDKQITAQLAVSTGAQQITKPVRMLSKGGTYDLRDWKKQSIKDENTFKSEKRISDNCSQTALCVKILSRNFSYTPSNYRVSE